MRCHQLTFMILTLVRTCMGTWCGLDIFGICKAAERVAQSLDELPERVREAADEVMDHFFDHDLGPAIDKLTAAAKGLEDHALEDYKKAINATEQQLEQLAKRVVRLAEELAKDLTKDAEQLAKEVEQDCVEGVTHILSAVDEDINKLLDRLEIDGKELICAAEGYLDNMQREYSAYFEKQDCGCVQNMLEQSPGLKQDCQCTSCAHLGNFYPSCPCKPWGLRFAPGWFNRGKYQFLKCHLMKPIDWQHWTVGQITAQLAIVQEAALSFRCLEDMMPGSTINRDYFSAEYLNITHMILVWSSQAHVPRTDTREGGIDGCEGKSIPDCVTDAMALLKQAQQSLDEATKELANTEAEIAANYSTKADLAASQQRLQVQLDDLTATAPVGAIFTLSYVGHGSTPSTVLPCDGSNVSRTEYAELFKAIGTTWGEGDSFATFGLPDFRGRAVIGEGRGKDLSLRVVGEVGGEESHNLTAKELPKHGHSYIAAAASADITEYAAAVTGHSSALASTSPSTSGIAGGSVAHNNLQPYAVVSLYIKARSSSAPPKISAEIQV